nr:uncharacterized protein LOC111515650 [Leptinotarsa decemlineata]
MLDEISLKKQVEFHSDKIWGYMDLGTGIEDDERKYATNALPLMVVSVTENWKIPIAYSLINGLGGREKTNTVKYALRMLSEVNVTLVSINCDGSTAYFNMAQALGAKLNIGSKTAAQILSSSVADALEFCESKAKSRMRKSVTSQNGGLINATDMRELLPPSEVTLLIVTMLCCDIVIVHANLQKYSILVSSQL